MQIANMYIVRRRTFQCYFREYLMQIAEVGSKSVLKIAHMGTY